MLTNFLSAFALMLVFEGIMPFAFPNRWKKLLRQILNRDEKVLRIMGFVSMIVGVVALTIIHQFSE